MFKPTWLYIKQHNKTGLKYFGKTVRDPDHYKGSGTRWQNHLKKHGNDVTTIWKELFTDDTLLTEYALKFSHDNNIVELKEWANLMPEGGGSGLTEVGRKKMRAARAKQPPPMLGKKHSEETKRKISEKRKKQVFSETTRKKMSETQKEVWAGKTESELLELGKKISESRKYRDLIDAYSKSVATRKRNGSFWHSEETKQKISKANKLRHKKRLFRMGDTQ